MAAVVCGGRARGRAPLGGPARVPWGPTHGLGRGRRAGGAAWWGRGPVGCDADGPGEVL